MDDRASEGGKRLPTIAQSRLPELYDEYYEIASRHGAAPRTSRNLRTASAELLRFVFATNAPPVHRDDVARAVGG